MRTLNRLAPIAALLLLLGMAAGHSARPTPADAQPYHRRIRALAAKMPERVGEWTSHSQKVPYSARELLKPNVMISRVYTNLATGEQAVFVLVQSRDARNMIGHYPPNCYPRSGWTSDYEHRRTWRVKGRTIKGMAYGFSYQQPRGMVRWNVANVLILPDGRFVRSMGKVTRAASDYTRHFFGAAQVQVITRAGLPQARRERIFKTLVGAGMPLINAIRSGVKSSKKPPSSAKKG